MFINQSDAGKWVRLKSKSDHGKNRIREHGDLWLVAHVDVNKVMLQSLCKTFKVGDEMHHGNCGRSNCNYGRWIDQGVDENFEIVELTEKGNENG